MAFARYVPGLGSVMGTESNQSSENCYVGTSREDDRQHTGLFRRDDQQNIMPPWSVPPGLMVPGLRQPEADVPAAAPDPGPGAAKPGDDGNSWPGVAPPAGWFLRAQPRPGVRVSLRD